MTRALILGGGGITGIAWESGVLSGLRERGVDTSGWDLVVGTSAGSIVGSKVLAEPDFGAFFGRQLIEATAADDVPIETLGGKLAANFLRAGRRRGLGWTPRIWLTAFALETFVRQRAGRRARPRRTGRPDPGVREMTGPDPTLRQIGAFGLAARTASEAVYLKVIEETLDPVADWPDGLVVTAIDAETGAGVAIDGRSGVPYFDAVAASCAVPGLMPPVTIGERRYIDGGMASQTHADLAIGHDEVLVVAPLDLGRLTVEVEQLKASGSRVTIVTPSPEAARAIGRDIGLLDPARRARAARAGLLDGRRAAEGSIERGRVEGQPRLAGSES